MTTYEMTIREHPDGQFVVEVNGSSIRFYCTQEEAKAFVDGVFYDGYPREQLERL